MYRIGRGRPVAIILTCTLPSSLTSAYYRRRSRTKWSVSQAIAEVPEGRLMTKGKFWKVVCDLYAEAGRKH